MKIFAILAFLIAVSNSTLGLIGGLLGAKWSLIKGVSNGWDKGSKGHSKKSGYSNKGKHDSSSSSDSHKSGSKKSWGGQTWGKQNWGAQACGKCN